MTTFDPKTCIASALHAHRGELRRYVASRVPPGEVDDALQLAALRAIEKAGNLKDATRVRPWLYRIHANILVDLGRKKASERRLLKALAHEPDPGEDRSEPVCSCSVALSRELNANYAAILDLVYVAGMPLAQAARTLSISVSNASVRLHRARAALKKRLHDHCGIASAAGSGDCRCAEDGCCLA